MVYLILRVHFCRELFNYYKLDCKFLLSTNFFYYSLLSLFFFSHASQNYSYIHIHDRMHLHTSLAYAQ